MTQPPRYRPAERFWPYADLSEQPSDEELAALDPDLRAALMGAPPLPFSLTVVFPRFEGDGYARAVEVARAAADYREMGAGPGFRHRARFFSGDAARLRDLYELVGGVEGTEVLIDDKPVPYARELWLPLVWFLLE
ncbi:MAG TPA: hypothetical protein VMN81_02575 [Vicinamibacterales bacterium]|nr:hypothetical protein [Vicinamibacterales bacterium]